MQAYAFSLQELRLDGGDDFLGDLVLEFEDVRQVAIITVGPDVVVRRGVDELGGDAHAVAALADAALQDVAHAKLASDAFDVDGLALVIERRIPRDDEEPAKLRQTRDDVLGNTVGEVFLLRVAAHIDERQDGDRGSFGARCFGPGCSNGAYA